MTGQSTPPPVLAGWLALSGLAPFLALAVATPFAAGIDRPILIQAAIAYSAVVGGFSGGVRWGAELVRAPDRPDAIRLAAAGLMTVPAWGALLLRGQPALAIGLLALASLGQLVWDVSAARSGLLPAWTLRQRVGLTLIGLVCLALIGFYPQPL